MSTSEIEVIEDSGSLTATIIRRQYNTYGFGFLTSSEYSQQLACTTHPRAKRIYAPYSQDSKIRAVIHDRGI
jgi:hypothetical protein